MVDIEWKVPSVLLSPYHHYHSAVVVCCEEVWRWGWQGVDVDVFSAHIEPVVSSKVKGWGKGGVGLAGWMDGWMDGKKYRGGLDRVRYYLQRGYILTDRTWETMQPRVHWKVT